MNTEPFNENESSAHDEFGDEQFLQEFNRELWHLFKRADDYNQRMAASPAAESVADDAWAEELAVDDAPSRCLSFARCAEIGGQAGAATETEQAHLRDCRYCERVVLRFAGQTQAVSVAATPDADAPEPAEPAEPVEPVEPKPKKTWREWLFPGSGEARQRWFGLSPATPGMAILLLVALGGLIFIWTLYKQSGRSDMAGPPVINLPGGPAPPPQRTEATTNTGAPVVGSANPTPPVSTASNSPTPPPPPPSGAGKEAPESKGVRRQDPPNEIRASINEGLRAAGDFIPMPVDVKSFFTKLPPVRPAGKEPKLLSPNREAIVEDQPTFRWTSPYGTSFKIIVRDESKVEVEHGEQLTGNSWVIPKKLTPGIYYWEIYAFDKDGRVAAQTQVDAIFKVVDRAEVEQVRSENISHLDKALYFIEVGLLKDAEIELVAEVKKTRSQKARNMLRQVRGWQKRLRVT